MLMQMDVDNKIIKWLWLDIEVSANQVGKIYALGELVTFLHSVLIR